jgi:hypothetical protein
MINGDTLWGFEYLFSKFGLLLNVDFELDGRELESRGGRRGQPIHVRLL